jgi:hypothetical protein
LLVVEAVVVTYLEVEELAGIEQALLPLHKQVMLLLLVTVVPVESESKKMLQVIQELTLLRFL